MLHNGQYADKETLALYNKIVQQSSTGHLCLYDIDEHVGCNIDQIVTALREQSIRAEVRTRDITCNKNGRTKMDAQVLHVCNDNVEIKKY